jgi:hypothetical protein
MLDGALPPSRPPARHDALASPSVAVREVRDRVVETWRADIEEFLELRDNTGGLGLPARGPVAFVAATTILIRMGRARHLRVTLVPMAWLVARGGGRP